MTLESFGQRRMTVIAVPNRHFPPSAEALSRAALVVASLVDLTEEQVGKAQPHERETSLNIDHVVVADLAQEPGSVEGN
jgi:hypothetical protein